MKGNALKPRGILDALIVGLLFTSPAWDAPPAKWGYIDRAGTVVVAPQFDEAAPFSDGLAPVKSHGRWGYIDKAGRFVLKPEFPIAGNFHEGLAPVKCPSWTCSEYRSRRESQPSCASGWVFIDKTGTRVFDKPIDKQCFYVAHRFFDGKALMETMGLGWVKGPRACFVNKNGECVTAIRGNGIREKYITEISEFSEGLALVKWQPGVNDRTTDSDRRASWSGFCDESGEVVLMPDLRALPQSTEVWPFSEGLARVRVFSPVLGHSGFGYIDKGGRFAIKPGFSDASDFVEGLAAVEINNGSSSSWGYIDKSERIVIEPRFGRAGVFFEGVAWVLVRDEPTVASEKTGRGERRRARPSMEPAGKVGFIDKTGRFVIPPQFENVGDCANCVQRYHVDLSRYHDLARESVMMSSSTALSRPWMVVRTHETNRASLVGVLGTTTQPIRAGCIKASYFSEGLAPVKSSGKWGYVDKHGSFVIQPKFDFAGCFSEGLAPVRMTVGRK
jgi:hypothetical protein